MASTNSHTQAFVMTQGGKIAPILASNSQGSSTDLSGRAFTITASTTRITSNLLKSQQHRPTHKMFRAVAMRGIRAAAIPRTVMAKPVLARPQAIRFYAGFPALSRDVAKERIVELLEGYDKVTSTEITEASSFVQDLGLDSLDVVEVVMEVEHEFNIQIPDHEADTLKTVGQTIDYILSQPDAC